MRSLTSLRRNAGGGRIGAPASVARVRAPEPLSLLFLIGPDLSVPECGASIKGRLKRVISCRPPWSQEPPSTCLEMEHGVGQGCARSGWSLLFNVNRNACRQTLFSEFEGLLAVIFLFRPVDLRSWPLVRDLQRHWTYGLGGNQTRPPGLPPHSTTRTS